MKKYDYLIIGSGLFGSIFAYEMNKRGKKCLVIEKRSHIAGNLYTEKIEGINVHKYGAHIFHTDNEKVWNYVNSFIEFNRFTNSPIANYKGKLYNLPFNMNTFYQLWGVKTPDEAIKKIKEQISEYNHITEPKNLEEQALILGGKDIYQKLIKGYTEKQWGRSAKEIPAFIIRRLPFRFTFDNNYFNDKYQGIPIGGYTALIEKMLEGIEVKTNIDYFSDRVYWNSIAKKIVYTGKIDEFFNYEYGYLDYRSLRFESEILDQPNYQGNAVINFTEREVPYTRIIEHEAYYPINDDKNQMIYDKYKKLADNLSDIIFGGRLAEYKYYDMHQVIEKALKIVEYEQKNYFTK